MVVRAPILLRSPRVNMSRTPLAKLEQLGPPEVKQYSGQKLSQEPDKEDQTLLSVMRWGQRPYGFLLKGRTTDKHSQVILIAACCYLLEEKSLFPSCDKVYVRLTLPLRATSLSFFFLSFAYSLYDQAEASRSTAVPPSQSEYVGDEKQSVSFVSEGSHRTIFIVNE